MLNQLIKEYARVHVSYAMVGTDGSQEIVNVLHKIENYLSKQKWQCNPAEIENKIWAMCAFFEMLSRSNTLSTPQVFIMYEQ